MSKLIEVCMVLTRFRHYAKNHGFVDTIPFAEEIDKIYNPEEFVHGERENHISVKLQDELEPLPGVPRYTNVVVG